MSCMASKTGCAAINSNAFDGDTSTELGTISANVHSAFLPALLNFF